jgi:hypothetical protein
MQQMTEGMNWVALGAIGELLGAIAVVISLAYLATQVIQNTRAVRAGSADGAVRALQTWIRPLIQDPEISRVFRMGVEDWHSLDADGKARFFHIMLGFMKTMENLHFQYTKGALDPGVWRGWEHLMTGYIQSPGGQAYWQERRRVFSKSFRKFVEALPENQKFTRAAELTGEVLQLQHSMETDAQ